MNAITNYFQNAVKELHNVTWPTHRQAAIITVGTIVFVLISAFLLGWVDWVLTLGTVKFVELNPFK